MTTAEIAGTVGGWATLATMFIVLVGVVFAVVQLRQGVRARRLQALMAVYSEVWPPEVGLAALTVASLPGDPLEFRDLEIPQQMAVRRLVMAYERLGFLLKAGFVEERDIIPLAPFGRVAITFWEKLKGLLRSEDDAAFAGPHVGPPARPGLHFEYLAGRAERYLLKHGEREFGGIPVFDADLDALALVRERVAQARAK